jgi:hypothetical protein
VFPGLTDHPTEIAALERLIDTVKIDMIQARNLNMDPEWYIAELGLGRLRRTPLGIRAWITRIQNRFPTIKFGYFNPPRTAIRTPRIAC